MSEGGYGFDDYVADVVAASAALGGDPPLVIGHSMGGYIAARLAAQHPTRVAGVVITDILTTWPDDFAQFARRQAERPAPEFANAEAAGERFRLAARFAHAAGRVRRWVPPAWWRGVRRLHIRLRPARLSASASRLAFLAQIAVPALVVHGEHSPIMSAESCQRVAAAIPRGQPMTLAGAHHHLVVEDPEEFARSVLRWSGSAVFRVQS